MTTEELYEAFRKKYQDDIRIIPRARMSALDQNAVNAYLDKLKQGKPNLTALTDGELCELMSITRDGVAMLSAVLLFGLYPQAYLPQICITAIAVPGTEIGDLGSAGERFIDNKRIEGSIPQMLEDAMQFVRKNMRTKTIIDPLTAGERIVWITR